MEKRFFALSAITSRINVLLQPAIASQFWVKAEVSSGRERGGSFYCDLTETDVHGKLVAKVSCTITEAPAENSTDSPIYRIWNVSIPGMNIS